MQKPYQVIHEGTSCGVPYRQVVKEFKTRAAAERYAENRHRKEYEGLFYATKFPKALDAYRKGLEASKTEGK